MDLLAISYEWNHISSTKLEIRAEKVLPGREGGERG
jgi:hypothetical protein